jgi:hypothetical protein
MATKNQDWLIGPFVKQLLACVHRLPVVRPEKVLSSVLLVRGEFDGIAAVPDLEEVFNRLPNGDRKFVIQPGTAHSMSLAINRQLFRMSRGPFSPCKRPRPEPQGSKSDCGIRGAADAPCRTKQFRLRFHQEKTS